MTTQIIGLKSFVLGAQEGRTEQPLNILGAEMLVKLANHDTNGVVAILHHNLPPMSGPPLHRHSREDEWFYVLDGQITVQIDGQQTMLRAGGSAFAPRGTAHAIQNFGPAAAQVLVMQPPVAFKSSLKSSGP